MSTKRVEEKRFCKFKYLIHYPDNFDISKQYPLWIHLHGSGGRGEDTALLKSAGPIYEIENGRKLPAIVVAPQCYADTWFEIMEQLLEFIEFTIDSKNTDKSRVVLSGTSMGGYGCWSVAMARPQLFSAVIPVCGGGMYWNASKLKDVPIWAFHGKLDQVVYLTESEHMVTAVNNAGGKAKLTVYENTYHDSWTETFSNDEVFDWALQQRNIAVT